MLEYDLIPRSAAYKHLVTLARNGSRTEYNALANVLGLDLANKDERNYLSSLLEMISRYEADNGRPMLSAIVLSHKKKAPNRGFFELARELGFFTGDNELEFHQDMLRKVYAYWGDWADS